VLRKALAQDMPVILIINKVDRPDARIAEVVDECYELFLDLDADEKSIDFPIVYCQAKTGQASLTRPADGTSPDSPTSSRCSRSSRTRSRPRPTPRARRCRRTSPTWTPPRTSAGWRCAASSTGR
jgi:hypothetical protein